MIRPQPATTASFLSLAAAPLLLLLACAASAADADAPALYGRRIVVETSAKENLTFANRLHGGIISPKETADEMAYWLERMTGEKFTVSTTLPENPGPAIYLLRVDSAMVDAADRERLRDKGLEAFILRGDAGSFRIIANDLRGLTHGAYTWLELLGVRWLMAGANWTVAPKRNDITLTVDRLVTPSFFSRGYFGSGGCYSWAYGRRYTGSPTDRGTWSQIERNWPAGFSELEREWTLWSRRMRNGGQALGKAMGEGFIGDKKVQAVLKAHPEYLAKIDGQHTKLFIPARPGRGEYVWDEAAGDYVKSKTAGTGTHELNIIVKLNAGNPDAVELFANWILDGLRAARKGPQGYAVQTASVEPSDGTGEGNNYDELKAQGIGDGSESDQEFYIANYCARKIRAEFPDVSVIMLAYAQRTDPPTFPLEPNFIVQPAFAFRYGKKTHGLSNEDWIALWKARAPRMAIYDYWSIPDWTHDEPDFNYLELAKKLRYFHGNNIRGVFAESTFGGGAIGIAHYLASHLMWDINLDEKALLEDWYDNAFGPAKTPMKRMLERWARSYRPISVELGMSYGDIREAQRLAAGNAEVLARVDDFARYLHYLRLRNELLATPAGEAKNTKLTALSEYLFDINDSRMVHTTRIVDQGHPASWKEFHLHNAADPKDAPNGPGWARVHALSHDEVAALIADGLAKYPPPDFTMRSFTGKLVPVTPLAWKAPTGDPWGPTMAVSSLAADLQVPEGLAAVPLRVSRTEDNKVTVLDDAGRTVFEHAITKAPADNMSKYTWDEMSIPLAPGHYRVAFAPKESKLGLFLFQTWKGVPLVLRTFQIQKPIPSPRLYFYVPKGIPKVAIFFPATCRAAAFETPVYLPTGARAKVEERDGGKLMVIPVPAGMDGQVWSLDRLVQYYENFETLTIPQVFAFSPEALLIPEDAR